MFIKRFTKRTIYCHCHKFISVHKLTFFMGHIIKCSTMDFQTFYPLKKNCSRLKGHHLQTRNARILQISLNILFRPIRLIWSMRTNSFYDNESVELSRNLLEKEFYIKRFILLRSFGYGIVFPAQARYALFLTYCILSLRLWFRIFVNLINLSFRLINGR